MTGRPVVFVDTETTCLGHRAVPWEVALIRREPDGSESTSVLQMVYEPGQLPEGTSSEALRIGGWLTRGAPDTEFSVPPGVRGRRYFDEKQLAVGVWEVLRDQPLLVGVGVHFDAAVLSAMLRRNRSAFSPRYPLNDEPWHYAIVDLKAVTWGYLQQRLHADLLTYDQTPALELPMASEALSRAIGVGPPEGDERHTALGDARWARRWFDRLAGGDES